LREGEERGSGRKGKKGIGKGERRGRGNRKGRERREFSTASSFY